MTKPKTDNRAATKDLDLTAIAGVGKYFANITKMTFAGTDYTPSTLQAALQTEIDAITALDQAKAAVGKQVATTLGVRVKTRTLRAAVRKYILSIYTGETLNQVLNDFGMKVPKIPGPKTAKAKAQASAKAVATHKARKAAIAAIPGAAAAHAVATVSTSPAK